MDDIEIYTDSGCYLESIIKSYKILMDASLNSELNDNLVVKLHRLIDLELDLAIAGSQKALSELTKASKNNIVPIS